MQRQLIVKAILSNPIVQMIGRTIFKEILLTLFSLLILGSLKLTWEGLKFTLKFSYQLVFEIIPHNIKKIGYLFNSQKQLTMSNEGNIRSDRMLIAYPDSLLARLNVQLKVLTNNWNENLAKNYVRSIVDPLIFKNDPRTLQMISNLLHIEKVINHMLEKQSLAMDMIQQRIIKKLDTLYKERITYHKNALYDIFEQFYRLYEKYKSSADVHISLLHFHRAANAKKMEELFIRMTDITPQIKSTFFNLLLAEIQNPENGLTSAASTQILGEVKEHIEEHLTALTEDIVFLQQVHQLTNQHDDQNTDNLLAHHIENLLVEIDSPENIPDGKWTKAPRPTFTEKDQEKINEFILIDSPDESVDTVNLTQTIISCDDFTDLLNDNDDSSLRCQR